MQHIVFKESIKNKYLNILASEEINFFHDTRCTEKLTQSYAPYRPSII